MSEDQAVSQDEAEKDLTTALATVAGAKRGAEDGDKCADLSDLITDRLPPGMVVPGGDQSEVVREVLTEIITNAQHDALDKLPKLKEGRAGREKLAEALADESSFRLAAAGELLGLGDPDYFDDVLKVLGRWANYEELQINKDNQGPVRQRRLRAAIWMSQTTSRWALKHQADLLKPLAAAILDYLRKLPLPTTLPYVPRPNEERQLTAWLDSGGHLAVVAGDSGNGKSRLAGEVLDHYCRQTNTSLLRLKAATPISLYSSLRTLLDRQDDVDLSELVIALIAKLTSGDRASILLIDDVGAWSDVEDIMEAAPRCVITTEANLVPAEVEHQLLKVGPMEPDESDLLIRWFRPDTSVEEGRRFHQALSGKPRLMVDFLGMFADRLSVDEIREYFETDLSDAAAKAGKGSRSVDKMYRRYYHETRRADKLTAVLIAVLSYLDVDGIDSGVLSQIHQAVVRRVYAPKMPVNDSSTKGSMEVLRTRFLVELEAGKTDMPRATRRIFRKIVAEDLAFTIVCEEAVAAYFDEQHMTDGVLLSHRALQWVTVLMRLLHQAPTTLLAKYDYARLRQLVGDIRIGSIQIGAFGDMLALFDTLMEDGSPVVAALDLAMFLGWLSDIYASGRMARDEFAEWLDRIGTEPKFAGPSGRDMAHVRALTYEIRYRHAEELEFVLDCEAHYGSAPDLSSEVFQSLVYRKAVALDRLGYAQLACDSFDVFARVLPDIPLSLRLDAAATGCTVAARVQSGRCIEFYRLASSLYDTVNEQTPSRVAGAYRLLAEAWVKRSLLNEPDQSASEVVEKLLACGHEFLAAGHVRGHLEQHIEASTVVKWATLEEKLPASAFPDMPSTETLLDAAVRLREGFAVLRIELLEAIARAISDPQPADVDQLLGYCARAQERFEDARTQKQALLAAIAVAFRCGMPVRQSWLQGLFELVARATPSLDDNQFRSWLHGATYGKPSLALML